MLKRLLVITADYYPYPSSNTNCLEPLLFALEKDGWKIDIVTRRMREDSLCFEHPYPNRRVYRMDDIRTMHTIKVNERVANAKGRKIQSFLKGISFISKAFYYAKYCLKTKEPRFAGWNRNAVLEKCRALMNENKYTAILSVSHPVITHELAMQLKKTSDDSVLWFLYEFDPFCYNEVLYGKNCCEKLEKEQHQLFSACDGIFLTKELYDFYQQTPFSSYREKMFAIPFSNMKRIEIDDHVHCDAVDFDEEYINCVFGGALLEDIRNPVYAINVFGSLTEEKVRLNLLSGSNVDFLTDALKQAKTAVRLYPPQPREEAYEVMLRGDILVNFGNTVVFQIPGKIFEYMAMGKPIIHFQKIKEDPCLKYLKNYPMVLIINEQENNIEKHGKMIADFCIKYKGQRLTYEEVSSFISEYTSEKVSSGFVDRMNAIVNNELAIGNE